MRRMMVNLRCGIYSKIPLCCVIMFSVFGRDGFTMTPWYKNQDREHRAHYVPCYLHQIVYYFRLWRPRTIRRCNQFWMPPDAPTHCTKCMARWA